MSLKVPNKWIWDFWLAQDGENYHIFYLQSDNSYEDEMQRHWNVSIGHAVSKDCRNWDILPDALKPSSDPDAWDNKTTWTGSVIKHEQEWYMFYTGTTQAENGLVQRIGLATSEDLITWTKHPANPVLEVDTHWYEKQDLAIWHDEAWRDPYVVADEETGLFHAFITARLKDGEPTGRGVIAHATSENLIDWQVQPPVTPSGAFGHMEVPQVIFINEQYYLIFSCPDDKISNMRRERLQDNLITGTYYLCSPNLTGPYEYETEQCLFGDPQGNLYSGKLVQLPDKNWGFLAFRNLASNGSFIGDIIDPRPIHITDDGQLIVEETPK